MKNKTYVLKNAVILDGTENMQPITGKKLLIENGIIADILADDADTGSAEVIDLNGKYLMPGLINLHVHLPGSGMPKHTKKQNAESVRRLMSFAPSRAVVYSLCRGFAKTELLSGVTTIRTVGGLGDIDGRIRDAINSGRTLGPRMLVSNMAVSVPGGHMAGVLAYEAESVADCEKYVRLIAKDSPDLIKLMITGGVLDAKKRGEPGELKMSPELVKACCDTAHELGYKVAAHVESPAGLKAALYGGVDTIEHGAQPDDETMAEYLKSGAAHVCTISPAIPCALFDREISGASETVQFNSRVVLDGVIACAKAALKNGVPVGLGTDTACPYVTHYDMWRELAYFVKYVGVDNAFALHTATCINARIAGIDAETGTVEVGKSADLLICEGDPLRDISVLRNPSAVVMRGRYIDAPRVKKYPNVEKELDKYL